MALFVDEIYLPKSIPQIKFLNVVIVTLIQNKTDIINNQ